MALQQPAPTYYEASAGPAPRRPHLAGDTACDVCVVGGGLAGISAALQLAERGYSVVVLEDRQVGFGASGRNGAQVLAGVAASQDKLEGLIGAGDARKVWDVTVASVNLVREQIGKYGIDADYVPGHMLVGLKARHDADLRAYVTELVEKYDYEGVRYMPRDEVRATIQSGLYTSAMYDPHASHIHPLKYLRGLAAAAERRGVRIFEDSRALGWDDAPLRVRTAAGTVRCAQLVLCGNVYLGDTAPALARKIMAVGTCIVTTAPLGADRAQALITNNACVADMNWVLDYYRRTADHRLLFGGRVSYAGLDPDRIAADTRVRMLQVFPQLNDVEVDFAWGGNVDITLNRAPHFGRLDPRVYFLQGFSGHGVALTGMAGKLVSDAIAGQSETFDVFARIPHADFPGGLLLRRPALVLAMMYYRIRDLLP